MARPGVRGLAIVCLVAFCGLVATACGGNAGQVTQFASPVTATDPPALVNTVELLQTRCVKCHSLDRITQARKTQGEWHDTVSQMRSKGAQLTDPETQALVTLLARTFSSTETEEGCACGLNH